MASVLVLIRFVTKTAGVVIFAHASGITRRKGFLTGLALTPISVFVILLLEQTRRVGLTVLDGVDALAAMTLFLEVIGPVVTLWALTIARETSNKKEE